MSLTRRVWIERCLRQIYNGQPSDDATITVNLVNVWLQTAIGLAAKANYKDALSIDGIGYVNNSFYTSYKNIAITSEGNFTLRVQLPDVPIGIGQNEGISKLRLNDGNGELTFPLVPLSQNQTSYYQGMRPIPNKTLYYYEGDVAYIISTIQLNKYTANITMVRF